MKLALILATLAATVILAAVRHRQRDKWIKYVLDDVWDNPEVQRRLNQGLDDIANGRTVPMSQLRRDLGLVGMSDTVPHRAGMKPTEANRYSRRVHDELPLRDPYLEHLIG